MPPKILVPDSIETVSLDTLECHPDNPRRGDPISVADSMDDLGAYAPITCQVSTRYVIKGNHCYKAARFAGLTEYPVIWLDVDDAHARAILLRDNRESDKSGWDDWALLPVLEQVAADGLLNDAGYDDDELARLRALCDEPDPGEPAFSPPAAATVKVQVGPDRFDVAREAYEAWDAAMVARGVTTADARRDEVRRLLAL